MITCLLVILLILVAAVSARGELLLKEIMISEGDSLFSIYSTVDQTAKWIRIGQTFAEFKAVEFDAVSDTLTMQKGEARQRIKMQFSAIQDSGPEEKRARLKARQNALSKELAALSARMVKEQLANPGSAELETLRQRRKELEDTARQIDAANGSFVQRLVAPAISTSEVKTSVENTGQGGSK
ncbi:MAG: hypothetical protein ABIZ81_08610 [Opitutaceae bacterium]